MPSRFNMPHKVSGLFEDSKGGDSIKKPSLKPPHKIPSVKPPHFGDDLMPSRFNDFSGSNMDMDTFDRMLSPGMPHKVGGLFEDSKGGNSIKKPSLKPSHKEPSIKPPHKIPSVKSPHFGDDLMPSRFNMPHKV